MDESGRRRIRARSRPSGTDRGSVFVPAKRTTRWLPLVPVFYAAMYESIAAHSRAGLNVVVDVGHHDAKILADSARRLTGLPVLFVGVRCPIEVIMDRRNAGQVGREGQYVTGPQGEPIPAPVLRWQRDVHIPGTYDLEVDTSLLSPKESAAVIRRRLAEGPPRSAFPRLAASVTSPRERPS